MKKYLAYFLMCSVFLSACNGSREQEEREFRDQIMESLQDLEFDEAVEEVAEALDEEFDAMAHIQSEIKKAKAADKKPFVYFSASWCSPCQQLKAVMDDPLMQDAFAGVHIIELDYDKHLELASDEYMVSGIPAWSGLKDDGSSNYNIIDGGAWDANTPENMAPALKAYFNDETDFASDPFIDDLEE